MHLQYILAVATVLTTVSSFPHIEAGRRQLNGYEVAPSASSTEDPSESAILASSSKSKTHKHKKTKSSTRAYSLTEGASSLPVPTLSTGYYGTAPSGSYPTETTNPTGISPPGTGTGTGTSGSSPISTSSLAPYGNITSALPPTTPGSTHSLYKPSSRLPISDSPTSSFPTGGTGVLPPIISGLPTATQPHHGPYPMPTALPPPVTITQISTITQSSTFTVTVTAAASCAAVSVAPLSSAPYPILGNGRLGYPTGATATGTGGLPVGTGTGFSILPPFSAMPTGYGPTSLSTISVPSSVIPVQEAATSAVSVSATATASLEAYT